MQTSAGDPSTSNLRVQKPRLPKSYTDAQLAYLRSHLPEFERRSQGAIRGDAKKFALERATEFIVQFGLPEDFQGVEESEPRFKEQIYNWFKNTVGRTRRKLEGRPRSSKKSAEKASQNTISWATDLNSPTIIPYSQAAPSSQQPSSAPISYSNAQPSTPMITPPNNLTLNLNVNTLRDAFLTPAIETNTLSSMIQTFVISNPSHTPLNTIVHALFNAVSTAQTQAHHSSGLSSEESTFTLLRRFLEACAFFPSSLLHAGASGPLAGSRALQMHIRKASFWTSHSSTGTPPSSIADDMERVAADRQRRKDYIRWARIHAAALELGVLDPPDGAGGTISGRVFAEMMARDAVWEQDEVEWVAGVCVLRAVVRTEVRSGRRRRDVFEGLVQTYESRWKDIKDETRQALFAEVLLGTKEDLLRLDEPVMA